MGHAPSRVKPYARDGSIFKEDERCSVKCAGLSLRHEQSIRGFVPINAKTKQKSRNDRKRGGKKELANDAEANFGSKDQTQFTARTFAKTLLDTARTMTMCSEFVQYVTYTF